MIIQQQMIGEIWKPIPGFPGYEVSKHGRIRSFHKQSGSRGWYISDTPVRILKPGMDNKGYRCVNLRKNKRTYRRRIGNLVTLAFIGFKPHNLEVCHNDGDTSNDHLNNLRYDTHKANIEDAVKHGTMGLSGECSPIAKLTNAQVELIRSQYAFGGTSHRELAKNYSVSCPTITDIITGKSYKEAGGPITISNRRLTNDEIKSIRNQRAKGIPLKDIAERYDVSKSCVSLIARGKRH